MRLYARILREIDNIVKGDLTDGEKLNYIKAQLSTVCFPEGMEEERFDKFMETQERFNRHHTLFFKKDPFSFKTEE